MPDAVDSFTCELSYKLHKREEFNVIVTKNGDYRNIEPEFVLQFQAPLSHG